MPSKSHPSHKGGSSPFAQMHLREVPAASVSSERMLATRGSSATTAFMVSAGYDGVSSGHVQAPHGGPLSQAHHGHAHASPAQHHPFQPQHAPPHSGFQYAVDGYGVLQGGPGSHPLNPMLQLEQRGAPHDAGAKGNGYYAHYSDAHDHAIASVSDIEAEIMNAAPLTEKGNSRGGSLNGESDSVMGKNLKGTPLRRPTTALQHSPAVGADDKSRQGAANGWDVLEITGGVRNMSANLCAMSHLGALYMANNQISRIPPNIVNLKNLTILDLSGNRLRIIPPELGLLMQLRHLYLQQNFLRTLPFELGRLYKLSTLALDGNPLMNEIFEVYNNYGVEKFLAFLLDQLMDSPPPPHRTRVPVFQPLAGPAVAPLSRIPVSVVCYNVLCGQYCSRAQYGYCPTWALDWDYRRKGIMAEIRKHQADLLCLQEVETEQYYSFFVPELRTDGFEGCFVPKSRSKTMHGLERSHVDGCAIFYNVNKFEFVEEYAVEFSHLAMSYAHSDGCVTEASENMLNRVMPKDNVGLVALLRFHPTVLPAQFGRQPYLLVVNAHMHWDPEYSDVKLIQAIMLSSRLRDIANDISVRYYGCSTPDPQAVPIVFTGDMNSLQDSGVYEFFMKGRVPYAHKDFRGIRYKQCIARYSAADKEKEYLSHGLVLGDAYATVQLNYTNYTLDFKGVIDYVMYSKNHFNCLNVLRPLDKEWLESNRIVGFPHPHIPSDHIPLFAEFELFGQSVLEVERVPAVVMGGDYAEAEYAEAPAESSYQKRSGF
ncbi:CCR4-NOT transcription complex subunit 6-like-B [Paramacrobiotus metropolitanus]|uniref:CCR4-NOT transcription complex subunit 6-like-B n=1 Tax=Paramacrobiotus metropolitanus TaxID=2943436 RepID=UPI0024457EB5|nr:CCR4-NOT transcription complex subunit 6-like-B [Paramacrobiotus metropolitanus]